VLCIAAEESESVIGSEWTGVFETPNTSHMAARTVQHRPCTAVVRILFKIPVPVSWFGLGYHQNPISCLPVTHPTSPKNFIEICREIFELSCSKTERQTHKGKNPCRCKIVKMLSDLLRVMSERTLFHFFHKLSYSVAISLLKLNVWTDV